MKTNLIKKLLKISVVVALVFSLVAPAVTFAADGVTNTGAITVNNDPATTGLSIDGNQYSAYQILKIVKLGATSAANEYEVNDAYADYFVGKTDGNFTVPAKNDPNFDYFAVKYISTLKGSDVETLAKDLKAIADTTTATQTVTAANEKAVFDVKLGYYLIIDDANRAPNDGIVTAAMLQSVFADIEIDIKASKPSLEKEASIAGSAAGNGVSAQIGDVIDFKLTAKLPTTTVGYTTYTYVVTDTMTEGLTLVAPSVKVFANADLANDAIASGTGTYTANVVANADGSTTLTIDFDVIALKAAGVTAENLYITYSATLNENAVVSGGANQNSANLEYSRDPNNTNITDNSESVVNIYTFGLTVNKTDDADAALAGAKFVLKIGDRTVALEEVTGAAVPTYVVAAGNATTGAQITTDADGKFIIKGLKEGVIYTLEEIEAPSGYLVADPIDFTIDATYVDGTLTALTTDNAKISATTDGLTTTVVNYEGVELPFTGGLGTTMYYIVGGLLILAGVAYFATSKKKDNVKEN